MIMYNVKNRLTRFKNPEINYKRVFFDIITKFVIEPKFSKKELENLKEINYVDLKIFTGNIKDKFIVLAQSGVGKVNAALCAQYLAIHFGVEKIINTGIAGAAGKGLGVFDFVVSDEAVYR